MARKSLPFAQLRSIAFSKALWGETIDIEAETLVDGPGGSAEMHWRGGVAPPPPLQGAQTMPSHCLPDAKCQLQ